LIPQGDTLRGPNTPELHTLSAKDRSDRGSPPLVGR
jgi:hypothetical protein